MEPTAWIVLGVLAVAVALLYLEAGPPDQVMLAAVLVTWHLGIVTTEEAFAGFSNPSVLTIGSLFVVAKGVDRSGLLDAATRGLLGQHSSERGALLRLCLAGLVLSGFLNNTPLVALLMPIVRDWARCRSFAASKFLIPLSYSTIMGGLTTMIGSSTNLVINGLLEARGEEPFGFFDPAFVSLPVGMCGLCYLVLVAPSLLPERGGLFRALRDARDDLITELEITATCPYLGEPVSQVLEDLEIPDGALVKILRVVTAPSQKTPAGSSPGYLPPRSVSEPVHEVGALKGASSSTVPIKRASTEYEVRNDAMTWAERERQRRLWGDYLDSGASPVDREESESASRYPIFPVPPHEIVQEGDVLVLSLAREVLTSLASDRLEGFMLNRALHPVDIAGSDSEFLEVVLAAESPLIGLPVANAARLFSSRYQVALIALRSRKAQMMRDTVTPSSQRDLHHPLASRLTRSLTQQPGISKARTVHDLHEAPDHKLLFSVGDTALVLARADLELPPTDFLSVTRVAAPPPVARRTCYDVVPLVLFGVGLALTILLGVPMVKVAVTLSTFLVLGGWVRAREARDAIDWNLLILVASALGLATAVQSSGLSKAAAVLVRSAGLPPAGACSLLFLMTMTVTELVTNNAAAALGLPLAVELARELGLPSARPLAMSVLLAASTSYACPIGYATNLMVMAPGDYTFADFLRVGLPMDLLYWVGVSLVLPMVWPLTPLELSPDGAVP